MSPWGWVALAAAAVVAVFGWALMRIGSAGSRAEEAEALAEYRELVARHKAEADALAWRCPDYIEDTGA